MIAAIDRPDVRAGQMVLLRHVGQCVQKRCTFEFHFLLHLRTKAALGQ
jgi:hypothetical protein